LFALWEVHLNYMMQRLTHCQLCLLTNKHKASWEQRQANMNKQWLRCGIFRNIYHKAFMICTPLLIINKSFLAGGEDHIDGGHPWVHGTWDALHRKSHQGIRRVQFRCLDVGSGVRETTGAIDRRHWAGRCGVVEQSMACLRSRRFVESRRPGTWSCKRAETKFREIPIG